MCCTRHAEPGYGLLVGIVNGNLKVSSRVIPLLDADAAYLDVSVPERPVAGTLDSQVEVYGSPSTTP